MGSMPGYHVNKGPFAYLDDKFDGVNVQAYNDALAVLQGVAGQDARDRLLAATKARFPSANPGDANDKMREHFDTDWLGGTATWRSLRPAETLKAGLIAAIKAALEPTQQNPPGPPMPIEFFWVCAQEQAFQVYYSVGPVRAVGGGTVQSMTVIVFTPIPEHGPAAKPDDGQKLRLNETDLMEPEPIWVIKLKGQYESSPQGANYPGAITSLDSGTNPPWDVITRQIYYGHHPAA